MTLEIPGLDYADKDTYDLGQDHALKLMYTDETESEVASLILLHKDLGDPENICQGFAEIGLNEWSIRQLDPLTITPSFVCDDCGDHGIIRNGTWVDADFATPEQREPIEWLIAAITTFTDTIEQAYHLYMTPNPELQYFSPRELVVQNRAQQLLNWLQKKAKEHKHSLGSTHADVNSETEQEQAPQHQHYTAVSTHRSS